MSQAASQAAAFYREVVASGRVWGIRDKGGFPAPDGDGGKRAMPFWSSDQRARNIVATVPAYAGFEPVEIELEVFRKRWLVGLERDGLTVGVNWSGPRALGYDVEPAAVEAAIAHHQRTE